MGVITTKHLDDTELTETELAEWGPRIRESVSQQYGARIRELNATREYPNTDEGWDRLKARAWAETIETNEVCRTVSAISAQRRAERMLSDGSLVDAARPQVTASDVERILRAANPGGALVDPLGNPVTEEGLEEMVDLINDPDRMRRALSELPFTFEHQEAVGQMVHKVRKELGSSASATSTDADAVSAHQLN